VDDPKNKIKKESKKERKVS